MNKMKALRLGRRHHQPSDVPHLIEASSNTLETSCREEEMMELVSGKPKASVIRTIEIPQKLRLSNTQTVFWTSRTAVPIYICLGLYVWTRYSIFLHSVSFLLGKLLLRQFLPWLHYAAEDPEARNVVRYLRRVVRVLRKEGQLLLSGNYGRQVVTAYVIHACTAPGESYISFIIRHKMNLLNQQWMDDLHHWSERRLGYEASRRDIFH